MTTPLPSRDAFADLELSATLDSSRQCHAWIGQGNILLVLGDLVTLAI